MTRGPLLLVATPSEPEAGTILRGLGEACGDDPVVVWSERRLAHPAARRRMSLAAHAQSVAVVGFAWAVAPGIAPGDVVVASVVNPDGARVDCESVELLAAELRTRGLPVHIGPIACTSGGPGSLQRARLNRSNVLAVGSDSTMLDAAAQCRPTAMVGVVSGVAGRSTTGAGAAYHSLARVGAALVNWARAAAAGAVLPSAGAGTVQSVAGTGPSAVDAVPKARGAQPGYSGTRRESTAVQNTWRDESNDAAGPLSEIA